MASTEADEARISANGAAWLWALTLAVGMAILFAFTQWGVLDDVPASDVTAFAVGTHNAIGIVAIGGWNAIGVVAIGGANSIGVVTIGGLNSIGLISVGGINSSGLITLGGINSMAAIRGVRVLRWSPTMIRRGNLTC